jgi:hypothetical protein
MTAAHSNNAADYPSLVNPHNFSTKARLEDLTHKEYEAVKATIIANVKAGLDDPLPTYDAPKGLDGNNAL